MPSFGGMPRRDDPGDLGFHDPCSEKIRPPLEKIDILRFQAPRGAKCHWRIHDSHDRRASGARKESLVFLRPSGAFAHRLFMMSPRSEINPQLAPLRAHSSRSNRRGTSRIIPALAFRIRQRQAPSMAARSSREKPLALMITTWVGLPRASTVMRRTTVPSSRAWRDSAG